MRLYSASMQLSNALE